MRPLLDKFSTKTTALAIILAFPPVQLAWDLFQATYVKYSIYLFENSNYNNLTILHFYSFTVS